jgi:glycosyltransferase involved in cell wall biosynthesis
MNILCVHNYYQNPGGEDSVFESEKSLLESNDNTVIQYIENNNKLNNTGKLKSAYNTIWSKESKQKIYQLLQEEKPDVAHFHNTFLLISPSAYYACKEAGVTVVQTLHNYRLLCPSAIFYRNNTMCEDCINKYFPYPGIIHGCYRASRAQTSIVSAMLAFHRFLKTLQNQVDLYIALTEFARRKFIEGGLPEDKIVVKPNFVYPDPGVGNENGNYALYIGRISQEKGVKTLLSAFEKIHNIHLRIVGSGPLLSEIRNYNLNVELLGQKSKEEVIRLVKSARFLVFPSELYETFGLVATEAFACGVPVIASRLGAMEEIIEDGRTGLHFTPGDAQDLAAKVEWAWSNPERMKEMGKEARREYELKYTAEKNYKMLMEIYRKAIEINKMSK